MNEQRKLMRQIQVFSFAVYEAALYLDGHPCDKRAIEYYNEDRKHGKNKAVKQHRFYYEKQSREYWPQNKIPLKAKCKAKCDQENAQHI